MRGANPRRSRASIGTQRRQPRSAAKDFLHLLNPQLAAVHTTGREAPGGMRDRDGHRFPELGFLLDRAARRYSDWVRGEDFGGAYARLRSVLQILDGDDGRLSS